MTVQQWQRCVSALNLVLGLALLASLGWILGGVAETAPIEPVRIDSGALGDPLGNNAWSVRLQYKPMIRFIWFGALIMALGGIIAASDRRYRVNVQAKAKLPAREQAA